MKLLKMFNKKCDNKNAIIIQKLVTFKFITMLLIVEIVAKDFLIEEIQDKMPKDANSKINFQIYKFIVISLTENSSAKVKQRLKNKMAHIKYGNRKEQKVKKYIKILLWNKGNSDIDTHENAIKMHVKEEDPTVFIMSESNVKMTDNLDAMFPEYDNISKFEDNHERARVLILVKKNAVIYERVKSLENKNIATIWIKIKFNGSKWLYLCGGYRQWRLPAETGIPFTGSALNQADRFETILGQIVKAKSLSQHVLVASDMNIDISLEKNNILRDDI